MIRVENLQVSFEEKQVLKGITADFAPATVYGIVGLNGAGKTTFFNTLANQLKPNSGTLRYLNQPLTYKEIGYLEATNFFYAKITGREYLGIFKQTNPDFNLNTLQELVQLPLDELIENYSTGMRKKLALLGVLKQDKPIYILDEPFNGLDLETNKVLEVIIHRLKEKGKTVFLSSHIMEPLLQVCSQIHYLESGKFTKIFTEATYHTIEEELFKKLKTNAEALIANAV